jgi:hypothetical protein
MLKEMQADINHRTEDFRHAHPDTDKLTPAQKGELESITRDQKDVYDLVEELKRPAGEPEPEKGEKK